MRTIKNLIFTLIFVGSGALLEHNYEVVNKIKNFKPKTFMERAEDLSEKAKKASNRFNL